MSKDINSVLKHLQDNTITFTSTLLSRPKERVTFRPLKTKDQKTLVVSKADNEDKGDYDNFLTLVTLVDSCLIKNAIPLDQFTVEDFMSVLLDIKVKSLGQTVDLVSTCPHCKNGNNKFSLDFVKDVTKISLDQVKNSLIDISPILKITLGHITVEDFLHILEYIDDNAKKIATFALMIKQVEFDGEIVDLDLNAKIKIVEELSREQLERFTKFLEENKIEISAEKTYKCVNVECSKDNTVKMNIFELINFF